MPAIIGPGHTESTQKTLSEDHLISSALSILQPNSDRSKSEMSDSSSLVLAALQGDSTARSEDSVSQDDGVPSDISHFPHLQDRPPVSPSQDQEQALQEGDDEESAIAHCFDRSVSPATAMLRNRGAAYEKVGEDGVTKMHKFSLYETSSRFFLVGADVLDHRFRILKIDRTVESGDLNISEDDIVYTKKEMNQLLNAVDDGNKSSGGLKLRSSTWGLLGFIRFTGEYYMLLITKRSQVAVIGGHYVYQVDGTELISLTSPSTRFKTERHPEEARFVGILSNLDLSRSFYFSCSYDITHTLQYNIRRERGALREGLRLGSKPQFKHNEMFVWNHHLLRPAGLALKNTYDWCLPIMHGFVDQASMTPFPVLGASLLIDHAALTVFGRTVYITIIARRSRYFAGARFLKRGANDLVPFYPFTVSVRN